MNRRLSDKRIYKDFSDLAWIVLSVDSIAVIAFMVIWHLIKNLPHSRW